MPIKRLLCLVFYLAAPFSCVAAPASGTVFADTFRSSVASDPKRVSDTEASEKTKENLMDLQTWLTTLGYYSGEIDGSMSLGLIAALQLALQESGHTGQLNKAAGLVLYMAAEIKTAQKVTTQEALAAAPDVVAALDKLKLAKTRREQNNVTAAERLYREAFEIFETNLGPNHLQTATALAGIVATRVVAGRYSNTEAQARDALERLEKQLGPDDPNTLHVVNLLAQILYYQGLYDAAEPFYQRALSARERVLGPEHPDTLQSLSNLANLYNYQGRYTEAEELNLKALDARQRTLGPEDESTLISLHNLGHLYQVIGRYPEAESAYQEVLSSQLKRLNPHHLEVLETQHNLASLYETQGRFEEAERLYRRILSSRRRVLGRDHPDTLSAMGDLGDVLQRMGRYARAEQYLVTALESQTRVLGEEHPGTIEGLNKLASLYADQGRLGESEKLYKQAFDLRRRLLGEDHPSTLTSMNNLGFIYQEEGQLDDAEPLYRQAIDLREKKYGREHPSTLTSLGNLARLYKAQGRKEEAERLNREVLEIRQRLLGDEHPATLQSMNNLAVLLESNQEYQEAEPLYTRSLQIKSTTLGASHPDTLLTENNLALLYRAMDMHLKATEVWSQSMSALSAWAEQTGYDPKSRFELPLSLKRFLDSAEQSNLTNEAAARQTFVAQGWLTYDSLDKALTDLGARLGAQNPEIAGTVRSRQDARDRLRDLRTQYARSFELEDARENPRPALLSEIAALEEEIKVLDRRIARDAPQVLDLALPRPLSADEAQTLLDEDEALLTEAWTEDTLYIWLVTRDSINWKSVDLTDGRIAGLIERLRKSLDLTTPPLSPETFDGVPERCILRSPVRGLENRDFDLCASYEIYQAVLAPFENQLLGISNLIVVPDGPLEQLPMSLLVRKQPDQGRPAWLLRDMATTVLPTSSTLRVLRADNTRTTPAPEPYLGVAPGTFDAPENNDTSPFRGGRLASLPGTIREVKSLSQVLGASDQGFVTGATATESFIKDAALDQYRILSFATHGLMPAETATLTGGTIREPALALSPGDTQNDGLLTATEAATLKLNADWLLLSACNTAVGADPGESGFSGLTRAFFFAGARSMLVSHWPVDDRTTLALILETVRATSGETRSSKAKALQAAMLTLTKKPSFNHPFFWAPFSLIGDNRPVQETKK